MEGYDAKFEPSLEKRLECPICLLAQREPLQTPCGHRFCSSCILRALRETGPRCPVDNTRVASHQLFKDNFAKREVLSLHVRCHADDEGCKWHGELRNLDEHSRLCELVSMFCPNECGHQCMRRHLSDHLPSCTNKPTPCAHCSIFLPRNKTAEHSSYCSKIKLPESTLSNILKANEVLKWCGHLKMKVQGQSYAVDGYLTVNEDSEERFIQTASWSTSINLIPLTGQAAKIFLKTLEGPEVHPVTLHFSLLSNDTRASNFHKIIKKKYHAAVGLRLKSSSRRELMILYLYWSESRKRMMASVAELKNYLVREMQSRLQQLKRSTQQYERNGSSNTAGPSSRSSSTRHERNPHNNNNAYQPVRIINVPAVAAGQSATTESQAPPPASHVMPSILSWQLSPSFPAYPWRMQTAAPSVPFFTIPSTPPQFLPAHSYPYTFAPMPAIAAPPFSINPFQPVPAVTVPSYAGVTVPQVTGLNGEVIMSSTTYPPSHPLSDVPSSAAQIPAAVIPHFPHQQEDGSVSLAVNAIPAGAANVAAIANAVAAAAAGRPAHPVNQVSVVVDPRMNPPAVLQPAEVAPNTGIIQAIHGDMSGTIQNQAELAGHAQGAPIRHINIHMPQDGWMLTEAQIAQRNALPPVDAMTSHLNTNNDHPRPNTLSTQNWDTPGPSGVLYSRPPASHSPSASTHSSDTSSGSSALFSPLSSMVDLPDSDSEYSPNSTPYLHSDSQIDLSSAQSTPSMDESSPSSQQRGMSSALQTLADAAILLSSPQNDSPAPLEENTERVRIRSVEGRNGRLLAARNERGVPVVVGEASHRDEIFSRGASMPFSQSIHHHPAASLPPTLASTEDLPVFVPVIHPTNEVGAHARVASVPGSIPSGNPQRMMYQQPDRAMNVAVAVIPDVPPLMHVAQGPHTLAAPASEHYWPNIPIGAPHPVPNPGHHPGAHVIPIPAEQQQADQRQHRQQRLIQAAMSRGRQQQQTNSSFWEDVMPSLDMRLQTMPSSQPNM